MLRITPGPFHDDEMIEVLAAALCEAWTKFGLPLSRGEASPCDESDWRWRAALGAVAF